MELVDVGVEIERAYGNERTCERDCGWLLRQLCTTREHFGRETFGHVLALAEP